MRGNTTSILNRICKSRKRHLVIEKKSNRRVTVLASITDKFGTGLTEVVTTIIFVSYVKRFIYNFQEKIKINKL